MDETFKVIIAGGRTFNDYVLLCKICDFMLQNKTNIEIVSGTANGADKLGERYAAERGYLLKQMPADWDKYGKAGGYKRNAEMAKYGNALIAFWDENSKGTKHMIDLAKTAGLLVKIQKY